MLCSVAQRTSRWKSARLTVLNSCPGLPAVVCLSWFDCNIAALPIAGTACRQTANCIYPLFAGACHFYLHTGSCLDNCSDMSPKSWCPVFIIPYLSFGCASSHSAVWYCGSGKVCAIFVSGNEPRCHFIHGFREGLSLEFCLCHTGTFLSRFFWVLLNPAI